MEQSGHYRSQVEERPSCMLQGHWRPDRSCMGNEREEYSAEENDGDSIEDGEEGNITAAANEFGFMQINSLHQI